MIQVVGPEEEEEEDIIICKSVWNLIMVDIIQTICHFKFPMYESKIRDGIDNVFVIIFLMKHTVLPIRQALSYHEKLQKKKRNCACLIKIYSECCDSNKLVFNIYFERYFCINSLCYM